MQGLRIKPLEQWADVIQHHIAAWALRQAVAHLLANHVILIDMERFDLSVDDHDGFYRHARFIKEWDRLFGVRQISLRYASGVRRNDLTLFGQRWTLAAGQGSSPVK